MFWERGNLLKCLFHFYNILWQYLCKLLLIPSQSNGIHRTQSHHNECKRGLVLLGGNAGGHWQRAWRTWRREWHPSFLCVTVPRTDLLGGRNSRRCIGALRLADISQRWAFLELLLISIKFQKRGRGQLSDILVEMSKKCQAGSTSGQGPASLKLIVQQSQDGEKEDGIWGSELNRGLIPLSSALFRKETLVFIPYLFIARQPSSLLAENIPRWVPSDLSPFMRTSKATSWFLG